MSPVNLTGWESWGKAPLEATDLHNLCLHILLLSLDRKRLAAPSRMLGPTWTSLPSPLGRLVTILDRGVGGWEVRSGNPPPRCLWESTGPLSSMALQGGSQLSVLPPQELASLGLDRLKSALLALGLKCGG